MVFTSIGVFLLQECDRSWFLSFLQFGFSSFFKSGIEVVSFLQSVFLLFKSEIEVVSVGSSDSGCAVPSRRVPIIIPRTTKRKELHGTTPIRAICGTWENNNADGVDFFAYKISFKCSIGEVIYSSFVLLVASKLADDVANIDMELYLVSKFVNCKVSSCVEELHLTAEQVAKGKSFQELFFNGIFGKLYIGSRKSEEPREFLRQSDQKLWNPSYMFLLLPLESLEPFKINWKEIDSSASVVEFVKKYCLLRVDNDNESMDTIMVDSDCQHMVHFANTSIHKDRVKDVVVLAIHTGKIYSVLKLLQDEIAHSSFHGNAEEFSSFMDYFKLKY